MKPIDLPLTFEGHPDQVEPQSATELMGLRLDSWGTSLTAGLEEEETEQ